MLFFETFDLFFLFSYFFYDLSVLALVNTRFFDQIFKIFACVFGVFVPILFFKHIERLINIIR